MNAAKVDVLINVFGKPFQTALAVLSLLKWSGHHIDKVYFHEEPCTSEFERKDHNALLDFLQDRVVYFQAPFWLSSNPTDEERLHTDEQYRLSMRYQYGWEHSSQKYALIVHNDIQATGDIVGELLRNIGSCTAIGQIGQCWWCPAGQRGFCSPERYTEFRPKYHQLMFIYNTDMDYKQRRAYNLGLKAEYWENPWPLPECRVNEWCMLIDMEKARPATLPFGSARPLGSFCASGAKIGEDWEDIVTLDTGVQWFRDMNLLGHTFTHYPIERHIKHDRRGRAALVHADRYVTNEVLAKKILREEYPEFYRTQ